MRIPRRHPDTAVASKPWFLQIIISLSPPLPEIQSFSAKDGHMRVLCVNLSSTDWDNSRVSGFFLLRVFGCPRSGEGE
jgi:hypothetical protein